MQLSWPREGNKRRAIVLDCGLSTPARISRRNRGRGVVFLNVSSADVALSDALEEKLNLGELHFLCRPLRSHKQVANMVYIADYLHGFAIPRSLHISPFSLSGDDAYLLEYCE